MRWVGPLALTLVLVPGAAADALAGDLDWTRPTAAVGVVSLSTPGPHDLAVWRPTVDPPAGPWFVSENVRLVLHRWTRLSSSADPSPLIGDPFQHAIEEIHDATIMPLRVRDGAEVLLIPSLAAPLEFHAMACHVDEAQGPALAFPSSNTAAPSAWTSRPGTASQLRAACEVGSTSSAALGSALIHGADLLVRSWEYERIIETGTWNSPVHRSFGSSDALEFQETRILEIVSLAAPLAMSLPAANVELRAERFSVLGSVDVGPSTGRLAWGALLQQGAVDAFGASGGFEFARSRSDAVSIVGDTDAAAPLAAAVAGKTATPLVVVVVAGAATVGLLALIFATFYRRADRSVLEHPRRSLILDHIRAHPGVGLNELAHALGLRPAKVHYHLQRLTGGGLVRVHRIGGRVALFVSGAVPVGREGAHAVLRRGTPARLMAALEAEPGLGQATLARRLGITQPQVSRTLNLLKSVGAVDAVLVAGTWQYRTVGGIASTRTISSA